MWAMTRAPVPALDRPAALDQADMAARLRLSATRLARMLRRQADLGPSPSQLTALATIAGEGPLTLGALADIEHVAPPTITKVVEKLEAQGLIERRADVDDRRRSLATATPAGAGPAGRGPGPQGRHPGHPHRPARPRPARPPGRRRSTCSSVLAGR